MEAVIRDAGQFWLAILLCIFCGGIGAVIVPIWHTVRISQWNRFSKKYPKWMDLNAPRGTVSNRFRSSMWKLIVGLVFGGLFFLALVFYFVMIIFGGMQI